MSTETTGEHPLVALARRAIEAYVTTGRVIAPPADLTLDDLPERAPVFVSLHTADGSLRGCVGTIVPTAPTLAEQVIQEAIAAATRDPRFLPVLPAEVPTLRIHVDVLHPPTPVTSPDELDPKKYGIIVSNGTRQALLLPDIEGVDTVETQIRLARRKALIPPDDPITLYRFTVTRLT